MPFSLAHATLVSLLSLLKNFKHFPVTGSIMDQNPREQEFMKIWGNVVGEWL